MERRFYVYMYWDLSGVARYIGMGGTKDRWKSHLHKSTNIGLRILVSDLRKLGKQPVHRKVLENLTKDEACQEEIRLITLYGREGMDCGGTLFNRAPGGEITDGHSRPQTDDERARRSATAKAYWDSPKGQARKIIQSERSKERSKIPAVREALIAANRARKGIPTGRKQSEEWKKMIGATVSKANRVRIVEADTRRKHGENSRARWANPDFREKVSDIRKKAYPKWAMENPEAAAASSNRERGKNGAFVSKKTS